MMQELWSPLLLASQSGSGVIVRLLLDYDAYIEQTDALGWTPLFWAVYKNHGDCLAELIRCDAVVNIVDEEV